MITLSFCFTYFAIAFLSLSQKKHYQHVAQDIQLPPYNSMQDRVAGFLCLAISLSFCVLEEGGPIGVTLWIGIIAACALLQAALLTFWRKGIYWTGGIALGLIFLNVVFIYFS